MRECSYCGKLFEEKNGHDIFCSEKCRHEQRLLKRKIKRKEKINERDFRPRRSNLPWTDKQLQDRINSKSSKIIYIGGYSGADGWIYVQCKDCGNCFKYSAKNLRRKRPIQCSYCRNILSNIREQKIEEDKKENAKQREIERIELELKRQEAYIQSHTRICKRCGREYFGTRKYCSKHCQERQAWSDKDHKRRIRINNNYHESISLEILAKRDNDTCWLCGQKVDWTDFTRTEEGWFVAGKNYPSIDHVQPLSKGGSHTWNNVRLSHRHCNTVKNNNLYGEKENGQVILFC